MYFLGISLLLFVYMFLYFLNVYPDSFCRTFDILYLIFHKTIFVLGASLILLPSFMGHNKPTSWILSLRFFDPLSKLTYGLYMVHPVFILFNAYNTPGGEYATMNKGIVNYITWVVVGFTVSYIFSMVVETPCANLEGIFLFKRPSRVKKDDKPNEEPLKHFEDKIDIAVKDCENQNSHALRLMEEVKDELSSESSFENHKNISSRTPLLK